MGCFTATDLHTSEFGTPATGIQDPSLTQASHPRFPSLTSSPRILYGSTVLPRKGFWSCPLLYLITKALLIIQVAFQVTREILAYSGHSFRKASYPLLVCVGGNLNPSSEFQNITELTVF